MLTPNDYQKEAARTDPCATTADILRATESAEQVNVPQLLNACVGLSGETGEFNELVKKYVFHKAQFDIEHAKKELGDVCWYLAQACNALGVQLGEVMQLNVDKLRKRYPEGFDEWRANHKEPGDV